MTIDTQSDPSSLGKETKATGNAYEILDALGCAVLAVAADGTIQYRNRPAQARLLRKGL